MFFLLLLSILWLWGEASGLFACRPQSLGRRAASYANRCGGVSGVCRRANSAAATGRIDCARELRVRLSYVPRVWPAFAVSSGAAVLVWLLAFKVGYQKGFLIFAATAFCVGALAFLLSLRRKVGIIPLVLPSHP